MKSILLAICGLGIAASAAARELVIVSEAIPTCFQNSNSAIFGALHDAEEKAKLQCANPVLVGVQTSIKPGNCGFVQVEATYHCTK